MIKNNKNLKQNKPKRTLQNLYKTQLGNCSTTDKIFYKILDGQNRIGANLIELYYNSKTYLIECGTELEPTQDGEALRKRIQNKHYSACFISHYHCDHAGLLNKVVNCDSIYMGESTFKILKVIGGICDENAKHITFFSNNREIHLNGLTVTPYLCDHSAYDSYMLHFKSAINSFLYTGDFRSNGRKNFNALLKRLPQKVNTLICEGTNSTNNLPMLSEQDLENKLVALCDNDKPIFVLQSATNIDRIVSVYRASIRSGRLFIMRLTQADICSELSNIPQPNGFKKCFTYPEFPMTDEQHKKYKQKYDKRLIGRKQIATLNKYVLEITSKDLRYLQKLSETCNLTGSTLVYSTWKGYQQKEDMQAFIEGVKKLGIEVVDLHASGHADNNTIDTLRQHVKADKFIQVHKQPK